MNGVGLFLAGLVGAPVIAVVGAGAVLWLRGGGSGLSPGSGPARRLGCLCPRRRNLWGLRESLRGTCELAPGCPVFEHHPDVRERMYKSE